MKPGSVVVDLAAEAGGNIETTEPGKVSVYKDVTHIGLTDLPSRLPTQASFLYGNNISKFLLSIGEKDHFNINLEDEVVRGSIILQNGQLMWPPPPPPEPSPGAVPAAAAAAAVVREPPPPPNYFNLTLKDASAYAAGEDCCLRHQQEVIDVSVKWKFCLLKSICFVSSQCLWFFYIIIHFFFVVSCFLCSF